jgi:stearoyl-CoA desaturase (delta-9 desaturase)
MCFLQTVLEPPHYGFQNENGTFTRPTHSQIWKEFFTRLNVFNDKRNWLTSFSWFMTFLFVPVFFTFFIKYFSWKLFGVGFVYSMVLMGTHGTVYLHRYGTHRAFKFSNRFWLQIARNLVIKVIPEEIYIVSHHVHHKYSEQAWDPYNVNGGWLYCFLADANHQSISRTLSEKDYVRVARMVEHTGVKPNTFEQYQRWGSVAHPARTIAHYFMNWALNFALFYFIGGMPLAIAIFGMAGVWAFGVRTYNYDGHGRGKDKRQDGIDFNRNDQSINQVWPGFVAGEWHNNHHLYASSARSGFLPYQVDGAWAIIYSWYKLGLVSSYRDDKAEFLRRYYLPHLQGEAPLTATPLPSEEEALTTT